MLYVANIRWPNWKRSDISFEKNDRLTFGPAGKQSCSTSGHSCYSSSKDRWQVMKENSRTVIVPSTSIADPWSHMTDIYHCSISLHHYSLPYIWFVVIICFYIYCPIVIFCCLSGDVILYCKALCFALFEHYNLLLWNWMENGLIWHGSDYGRSVNFIVYFCFLYQLNWPLQYD